MRNRLHKWVLGVLLVAGVALAPAAFARGHIGIGISLPGISVGFSDCGHCGRGYGWAGNYAYPAYYAPAYGYSPAYYSYPAYYGSAYYGPGYYGGGYYRGRPVAHRSYYRGDYGHRSSYYDRGGYYRR